MALSIRIKNLELVTRRLKKLPHELTDKVDDYMTSKANDIRRDAVLNVSSSDSQAIDNGQLKASISANTTKYLHKTVNCNVNYAAYVEFGTGPFAAQYVKTLPEEIQKYAMTFYVNGKGQMPARPFLFPAFFKNTAGIEKDLKKIVEKL